MSASARINDRPPAWFDLHSCVIGVDRSRLDAGADQQRAAGLDWALGPRKVEAPATQRPASTVRIASAPDLPEPRGRLISEYPDLHGGRLRSYRDDNGVMTIVSGNAASAVLLAGGDSAVTALPDADIGPLSDLMLILIDHAVTAHEQCLCHAACVHLPDGERCVLLHAASGTGKSTTATALTAHGFRISGDDTSGLLAGRDGAPVRAWGLPRGVRLHRRSVDMLPATAALVDPAGWDGEDEQMIDRDTLIAAGLVSEAPPLPVAGVFALARGQTPPTRITRSTPFDGLRDLLADNITSNEHGFFAGHERRMDIYSTLVGEVPCYHVTIADEPLDVARAIAETLGVSA